MALIYKHPVLGLVWPEGGSKLAVEPEATCCSCLIMVYNLLAANGCC